MVERSPDRIQPMLNYLRKTGGFEVGTAPSLVRLTQKFDASGAEIV